MSPPPQPPTALPRARRLPALLLPLAVVVALLAGAGGCRAVASARAAPPAVVSSSPDPSVETLRDRPGKPPQAVGVADGRVPDGVTAFDDTYPAVARLDPQLRAALQRATTEAAEAGVEVQLNSGWRSRAYQQQLLDQAVSTYGSRAEAARWVAAPATSPHVSGAAVDIRTREATDWLAAHGAAHGLCRVFRNEPWHFELRPTAVTTGCPPPYADAAHDPRMVR